MREVAAIRLLKSVGPPDEWSGGVATALGPATRKALTAVWDALSRDKKVAVSTAFRASFGRSVDENTTQDLLGDIQSRVPHPMGPPPETNRTKWPYVATLVYQGVLINVEQRPGDERTGQTPDGRRWATVFLVPYGEVAGRNRGVDGDRLDVFVGPYQDQSRVWIVREPEQDKVMLGFKSMAQALAVWREHYDIAPGIQGVDQTTVARLKQWLLGSARGRVEESRMRVNEMLEAVRGGQEPHLVIDEAVAGSVVEGTGAVTTDELKGMLQGQLFDPARAPRISIQGKSLVMDFRRGKLWLEPDGQLAMSGDLPSKGSDFEALLKRSGFKLQKALVPGQVTITVAYGQVSLDLAQGRWRVKRS